MTPPRPAPSGEAAPVAAEQRRFPRVSSRCLVAVKPVGDDDRFKDLHGSGEGLLQNISGGGVCVRMPDPVEEGALLALTIQLPALPTAVIALGKVVWATPAEDGCDAGIEFWWVGWEDPSTQERIRAFITDTLLSG